MRKPSGETLSSSVLEALVAHVPGVTKGPWRQAAWDAFRFKARHEGAPADFLSLLRSMRMEPDAYAISKAEGWLHFFEIEVYNPMTQEKLERYGRLALDLNYYRIEFCVIVVNKYGHMNEVDVYGYYQRVVEQAKRDGLL